VADVQESIWGCARQAGAGPNVGRQIAFRAGLPQTVPAYTVNQACGSGLKAIILATQEIQLGRAHAVLAGGVESMSRVPYFADGARWGMRMGNMELVDGMYRDGFNDPLSGLIMGQTAENLARMYDISRAEQDEFALQSQAKAVAAWSEGKFASQIVAVEVNGKKGATLPFERDEHMRADSSLEALRKLPPVFYADGTVTAGNSSGITDGAAAMLLVDDEALAQSGLAPEATIVDYEIAGVAPEIMGIGPVPAVRALLARLGLKLDDVDLVELNEAFAAQVIACQRAWASDDYCRTELGLPGALGQIDEAKLNVDGGAIALGHPVGASGTRIVLHVLNVLRRTGGKRGMAAICVGGGLGGAMLIERV
jgi:acetyl-CoA C-acetyltransferase